MDSQAARETSDETSNEDMNEEEDSSKVVLPPQRKRMIHYPLILTTPSPTNSPLMPRQCRMDCTISSMFWELQQDEQNTLMKEDNVSEDTCKQKGTGGRYL